MALPSSLSAVQSTAPTMASNLADGVVDIHFFSTKKISVLLDYSNYLLWRQ